MDIEGLVEFASKYLSEYVATFTATLAHPVARFNPILEAAETREIILPKRVEEARSSYLNPKLFTFVVISIFVGVTINALIPGRPSGPDLVPSAIVILISWFTFSSVSHLISRMIGGRGTFGDTLSVSLQLLAVIYVVSCFMALAAGAIAQSGSVKVFATATGGFLEFIVENPVSIYFFTQLALMLIYMPLALRHVHGFGWIRQLIVGLTAPVATVFSLLIFFGVGVMRAPPP